MHPATGVRVVDLYGTARDTGGYRQRRGALVLGAGWWDYCASNLRRWWRVVTDTVFPLRIQRG
jgi:hypothetical protein